MFLVLRFTVADGKIGAIRAIGDPTFLADADVQPLHD
jgi:hypothetical protein